MTRPTNSVALATAAQHLAWCATIPHTIDQVLGIYTEALSGQGRPMRHGMTNDEILRAITARIGGRGSGHSDPTPNAALRGEPDAIDDGDETIASITTAIVSLDALTAELVAAVPIDPGPEAARTGRDRTDTLRACEVRLHRCASHVDHRDDLGHLIHGEIGETAAWLHAKAEAIWLASRGEHKPVAVQRDLVECSCCSRWRSGTIARTRGLCEQCATFQGHHRCLPTEPIVRRWDYGKGATPAQVLEAKAASKARRKERAS